jgi:hypothetical protein
MINACHAVLVRFRIMSKVVVRVVSDMRSPVVKMISVIPAVREKFLRETKVNAWHVNII